ncbi:hypothetical protein CWI37_0218p0030 [Hamiltosporidium tvaerminnensis]|uniref:Uncharacterized protein n=1 Tax=Hamiltosporidium tvaerminnensis TaxID=1176355 RepID=A0A4Q9L904_9MICR|nr:hypothetical protein LUQ84_000406 [Hamiltosporidium tvaerminnensis]TBU03876.1 hypothetical protein CWI37_0218p0030 [Hamiltosporidium tvaerminnensis]
MKTFAIFLLSFLVLFKQYLASAAEGGAEGEATGAESGGEEGSEAKKEGEDKKEDCLTPGTIKGIEPGKAVICPKPGGPVEKDKNIPEKPFGTKTENPGTTPPVRKTESTLDKSSGDKASKEGGDSEGGGDKAASGGEGEEAA